MEENTVKMPQALRRVTDSEHQVVYTGIHQDTGVLVKGMLDMLLPDEESDLKSTSKPWFEITGRWWFERSGYATQRAIYGALSKKEKSSLVVTRTEGRYDCRVFDTTARVAALKWRGGKEQETALGQVDRLIREYDWRERNGYWEGSVEFYTNNGLEVL